MPAAVGLQWDVPQTSTAVLITWRWLIVMCCNVHLISQPPPSCAPTSCLPPPLPPLAPSSLKTEGPEARAGRHQQPGHGRQRAAHD